MSTLGLPVSNIVNVQVVMSPVAAATRNFGSLLVLGDSSVIDTTERIRPYSTIAAVAADFGTSAPEYKAALLYFGQTPQPSSMYIGKWALAATSGVLHGGVLSAAQQALANFTGVTSGAFSVSINGVVQNISTVNLSAVTNLNGVASAVTAKLSGGATCVWNASLGRFDIISGTTGAASVVALATAPGSGTDLAILMLLETGQGATAVGGIVAESLATAVGVLDGMSNDWYGLTVASSTMPTSSDYLAAAAYIEAALTSRILGVTTQDSTTLNAAGTSDLAYQLKALGYKRTFIQYSSSNAYACASIFGRAFTVNFNGANTTLTIKFKIEPGVAAENLTAAQAAALQGKNCNVFIQYNNNTTIIQEGVMVNGYFFDEIHGTDWLQNDVQTAVYNLLYASATKIPQTDAGVNTILTTISDRLAQAVTNGLVAPGVWNAAGFGAISQGDTLSKGYYVYAPPVASQSQADRAARKAPVIQCAIKLAGAVHFVNCVINVNR